MRLTRYFLKPYKLKIQDIHTHTHKERTHTHTQKKYELGLQIFHRR